MSDHDRPPPEQVLVALIARHGPALLGDPKRLKGLLWDLCHDRPRERSVLFAAVEKGVAADLARNGGAVAWELQRGRLVDWLHDETGIDLGLAGWTVETWAVALGVLPRERLRGAPGRVGASAVLASRVGTSETAASIRRDVVGLANIGKSSKRWGIADADWTVIPAGAFMMGSLANEPGHQEDEHPHLVRVAAFQMLRTPVTFAMYDTFCAATGRKHPEDRGWGRDDRPVIMVNYWDAVDYAAWLSRETKWHCRLPTEAEWEYACRAGTVTPFSTGAVITVHQANYDGRHPYHNAPKGAYRACTTPVKAFPPNPWGLHDMHGNVWEWCASVYDRGYSGNERQDASGERNNKDDRVLRGGCWGSYASVVRSAQRDNGTPDFEFDRRGFRLAKS